MLELIFPYLVASLITVVTVLTAIWAFVHHRRRAVELDQLEQRLPDACRYEDLQARLRDMEEEFADLNDELMTAKHIVSKRDEAERYLAENKEELLRVEAEREAQEKLRVTLEELYRQHAEAVEQSKNLRQEVETAEFRREKLREEERDLAPRVEQLRADASELQESVSSLRAEKASLETEVEGLRNQIAAWQAQATEAKSEIQRIRSEREQKERDLQEAVDRRLELIGKLGPLQKQVDLLRTEAGEEEGRLTDLWQPVLSNKRDREEMSDDESKCLQQVEQYIASTGYRFASRQLYALHTGLKIAEISPLTVLAGISGTGKSALPRLYANGMGMHFLNVAVQPRWDSPQDLFGFYNYLEHRYRATELARALVQMDSYAEDGGRGWPSTENLQEWLDEHWCCEDMLLILLDEMNLARVEYYFSEFLSRLEIRRDIDEENLGQRRQAEIALEVGSRGEQGSDLRVFPGRNILFTGTMNEDETTQTLSDKVVDRANVLRFGRPEQLLERDEQGDDAKVRDTRLSCEVWRSWIQDEGHLPPECAERVDVWVGQLNDALAWIHRPFGFRVQRAVRQYVANYPIQNEGGWNLAMADQVEQKILPKFRGLGPEDPEVSQALNQVVRVLGEIGDDQLLKAVRGAAAVTDRPFLYAGVDRLAGEDAED